MAAAFTELWYDFLSISATDMVVLTACAAASLWVPLSFSLAPPVSAFPELVLQAHATTPRFFYVGAGDQSQVLMLA